MILSDTIRKLTSLESPHNYLHSHWSLTYHQFKTFNLVKSCLSLFGASETDEKIPNKSHYALSK